MSFDDIVKSVRRMRNKDTLHRLLIEVHSRLYKLESVEREKRLQELVAEDPRNALPIDHRDHPRWDKERARDGWPGPDWVWSRRGEWRKLGDYDG